MDLVQVKLSPDFRPARIEGNLPPLTEVVVAILPELLTHLVPRPQKRTSRPLICPGLR